VAIHDERKEQAARYRQRLKLLPQNAAAFHARCCG
jgi:hypothetical protein